MNSPQHGARRTRRRPPSGAAPARARTRAACPGSGRGAAAGQAGRHGVSLIPGAEDDSRTATGRQGVTVISTEDAEEFTQSLGQILGGSWRQIALAERMGVPEALGLSTQEWVQQRLGGYTRLSVSERRDAARELTAPPEEGGQGMSQREAADVLGVSPMTVGRDLKPEPVSNVTPQPEPDIESHIEPESAQVGDSSRQDEPEFWSPEPEPVSNVTPQPEPDIEPHIEPEPDSCESPEPEVEIEPDIEPAKPVAHVGRNNGDNEWYTPVEYVKAATSVLGAIDLDPASSDKANSIVGAAQIWTEDDDGLTRPWAGRVWMNPPYAQPWCDRFCTRLAREFSDGAVTAACVLVNNATETAWFQEMAAQASAMCFPRGRVKFWHPDKVSAPLQGQAVLYLGPDAAAFRAEFVRFGFVVSK